MSCMRSCRATGDVLFSGQICLFGVRCIDDEGEALNDDDVLCSLHSTEMM